MKTYGKNMNIKIICMMKIEIVSTIEIDMIHTQNRKIQQLNLLIIISKVVMYQLGTKDNKLKKRDKKPTT